MAFFARTNPVEPIPPLANGDAGAAPLPPQAAGLPPFLEVALMRVAATILPQLQPLVIQAEQTMREMRDGMKELRAGQELLAAEIAQLRERLDGFQSH